MKFIISLILFSIFTFGADTAPMVNLSVAGVNEPAQFFELIDVLNNELYSINIAYPLSMIRTESGIEIEFNLAFNQLK